MNSDSLALDFKSATLYAVRVVLHQADLAELTAALDKRMADAGSFFENEPVVIDASRVDAPIDWTALLRALHGHNLPAIGVVANGENLRLARAAGLVPVELSTPPSRQAQPDTSAVAAPPLTVAAAASVSSLAGNDDAPSPADSGDSGDSAAAVVNGGASADAAERPASRPGALPQPLPERAARATASAAAPAAVAPHSSTALVITRPLRSGQRVYARHTDLVVIGMVSQGAEVIADGNVHVYGPLRGKAMAGARGDTSARIFTTHLDPELLAVAGVYRVVEDRLDPGVHGQPALVRLDGDTLHIEGLKR